jgi:DNA-binding beta-propeller fold protein YncE
LVRIYNYSLIALIIFILCAPRLSSALECVNTKFLFDIIPGTNQPSDIAVAPNGDIYLVDGVNNRIIVVDSNGRWKTPFGGEGSGKGRFNVPVGIDISDTGKVFVADTGNRRIQVFDSDNNFLYMFDVKTTSSRAKSDPVDVAVSKIENYLYVADNNSHKVLVYDQKGQFQFEWGKFGEAYGEFRYPGMMTINANNELLVVDVLNTRVQKFDPFGTFINDVGSWGVTPGSFFRPKGIAVDKLNRVFVSDSYMGVIQVFTDFGRFVGVVCERDKKRVLRTPVGIIVDKKNRLLVVEMRANKITVLKLLE